MHNQYKVVVIGGSAGSFQGVVQILSSLPENFSLAIVMGLHRLKHVRHGFIEALSIKSKLPIIEPDDKQPIKRGHVYLAPANYHLLIEVGQCFALSTEEPVNSSRPSIDLLMQSAAYAYREKAIGILLSGANRDGAMGMQALKEKRALTIVQDPATCLINTMPQAAIEATTIDYSLPIQDIVSLLLQLHQLNLR